MNREPFIENECYHLYNRGVDRRVVFAIRDDYERFKAYLYLLNDVENVRPANFFTPRAVDDLYTRARGQRLVAIGAYCLMPTHFHILATPLVENGISKFMQKITTAYTMYFNERTLRSGSLFQGTFKSMHAEPETYRKYIFAYIHLNPAHFFHEDWASANESDLRSVEGKIMTYPYSSAPEYRSNTFTITDPKHFPGYFEKGKDMPAHIRFWLQHKNKYSGKLLGWE